MKNDLGKWIGVGLVLGAVVGAVTNNMSLWPGVGLVLGITIGTAQENNKK
jgi:hypothetical protein